MKNGNRRTVAAAIPVVLVNVVAFAGQLAFLRDHLPWTLAGQVLVAVALESIAVYLAWQAHLAQLANDSALRLRLAAYGFGALIGVMNYSHYASMPGWRPTFAAVTVGLMSASSPWLWSIHTRRVSRDRLLALGLVEAHALRLGGTRWVWHLWRSARVMFYATWEGETDPASAAAAVYPPWRPAAAVLDRVPSNVREAAELSMRRTYAAGNPMSVNQLQRQFSLTRTAATEIHNQVFSLNGSGPHE
jgi:hypothetical protein